MPCAHAAPRGGARAGRGGGGGGGSNNSTRAHMPLSSDGSRTDARGQKALRARASPCQCCPTHCAQTSAGPPSSPARPCCCLTSSIGFKPSAVSSSTGTSALSSDFTVSVCSCITARCSGERPSCWLLGSRPGRNQNLNRLECTIHRSHVHQGHPILVPDARVGARLQQRRDHAVLPERHGQQ